MQSGDLLCKLQTAIFTLICAEPFIRQITLWGWDPRGCKFIIFQKYRDGHSNHLFKTTEWRTGKHSKRPQWAQTTGFCVDTNDLKTKLTFFFYYVQNISPDMKLLCESYFSLSCWLRTYAGCSLRAWLQCKDHLAVRLSVHACADIYGLPTNKSQ